MRSLALLAIMGCQMPGAIPARLPGPGIAIAIYDGGSANAYSVIDDRRWVALTGSSLELDHIDPGAALASLVIEPLNESPRGSSSFAVRSCTRDQLPVPPAEASPVHPTKAIGVDKARALVPPSAHEIGAAADAAPSDGGRFASIVRCAASGIAGRHLVRIFYVTNHLVYRAQHDITMTAPDRATILSRFAVVTPAWRVRADVSLFDGIPGGEHPPREVGRATIDLDGATAVISAPPHDLAAQLRRVYDGAVIASETPSMDATWARESVQAVWVWLELGQIQLARGPIHVHVAVPGEAARDLDVPAEGRRRAEAGDASLRLPLWVDESLHGMRQRFGDLEGGVADGPGFADGSGFAERFLLSIANLGDTPRDVWIEEHVRPAPHRRVDRPWPTKPVLAGEVLRSHVRVAPGKIERVGYTIAYGL